jgi:hypothetical protein
MSIIGIPTHPKPTFYRISRLGAIFVVTLAAFALALHVRRTSGYPPMPVPSLSDFAFDAYEFGVVFQEIMIPLALIALFSGTDGFRRIVSGESTPRYRFQIFGGPSRRVV